MTMTIACYCRTSTKRQKNDSQIAEIEKWLSAHGHDQSQVQWFVDQETGKTLKRPQLSGNKKPSSLAMSRRWSFGSWTGYLVAYGTA